MTGRHINRCINEWLDGCPFNQPDAIQAAREELDMQRSNDDKKQEGAA